MNTLNCHILPVPYSTKALECMTADCCLPALQLKDIAPEFYTTLKYHTSWIYVIWAFLTDSNVGPWTRMKRKTPTGTPADAPVMTTGAYHVVFLVPATCLCLPAVLHAKWLQT